MSPRELHCFYVLFLFPIVNTFVFNYVFIWGKEKEEKSPLWHFGGICHHIITHFFLSIAKCQATKDEGQSSERSTAVAVWRQTFHCCQGTHTHTTITWACHRLRIGGGHTHTEAQAITPPSHRDSWQSVSSSSKLIPQQCLLPDSLLSAFAGRKWEWAQYCSIWLALFSFPPLLHLCWQVSRGAKFFVLKALAKMMLCFAFCALCFLPVDPINVEDG